MRSKVPEINQQATKQNQIIKGTGGVLDQGCAAVARAVPPYQSCDGADAWLGAAVSCTSRLRSCSGPAAAAANCGSEAQGLGVARKGAVRPGPGRVLVLVLY